MPFKERDKLKTYICIVFTDFHHTKLYPFQNLSLEFILKVFLRFRKFQPQYSYKIYSYRKKRVYPLILRGFIVSKIISCWRTSIGIKNTFSVSFSWDTANCKLQSAVTHLQFHFAWILNFRQTFIVYHQL